MILSNDFGERLANEKDMPDQFEFRREKRLMVS